MVNQNIINSLKNDFVEIFGVAPDNGFFSPGRVNLIGEHTDYNGGNVFPCALSFGTYGIIKKRDDNKVRLYSLNFKELATIEFSLDNLVYDKKDDWTNYPKGVMKMFENHGYNITHGFDILIFGNIPNGAGLSSSASLEVLTGVILNDTFNFNIDMIDIVKMSQEAENKFIGVNCGIMDQFAVGMGKENNAILLNCDSLEYKYNEINMDGYKIVIANTNKKRGLADSKYNERRSQCESALDNLKEHANISSLCQLNTEKFNELSKFIVDETNKKRAKHAIYENERTLNAVEALKNNDLELFGNLMIASHNSLRDDYEVTGIELDTLVNVALKQNGVIGSRMTGAGFGGCTVSIVKEDFVESFTSNVRDLYYEVIGYEPSFYIANISDGAKKIF
ncbi:MAG: galactokinase [Clostridium sp.]|uniref:galactokinase n=1 Tax=Clostridium sp. TaxID=1506 RepID=UPI003F2EC951